MLRDTPAVEAIGLTRNYPGLGQPVVALDRVALTIDPGEVVAVVGPSGSGKSTLLHLLAGLDLPDAGVVRLAGVDWRTLEGSARACFRRRTCGYIVQGLALLLQATAAENIEVPLLLESIEPAERGRRVAELLDRVGLSAHADKMVDELSGGEQQRVSIARAIALDPAVVLADEPTGSLDSATAQSVVRHLLAATLERGAAIVMVTHDPAVARHAHRVVSMRSGRLE